LTLALAAAVRIPPVISVVLLALASACSAGGDSSAPRQTTPTIGTTAVSIAGGGLFVIGADGTGLTRIAGTADELYFGPAWSPDGTRIAVSRMVDQTGELYLLSAEGSVKTQLTSNGRSNYLPAWSPDGSALVFISQIGADPSAAELYRINTDGTNETRLTDDQAWDYSASWTRDGREVVFGSQLDGQWRIYRMGADGRGRELLTVDAAGNAPAVSPDGRWIAFTSDRDGDDDIYIMAPDGSGQRNLTANSAHDDNATWSPESGRVAFTSDRTGKNEIFTMRVDGSDVRQLTDDPRGEPAIASWSPDGRLIVFAAFPAD
jgi:Tol biopolymer transport system component